MVKFSGSDIFLFIIGFFLPPLAVGLKRGCGADFLISIGLTLLGHIPGIGYSWYIIYTHRDDPETNTRHSNGRAYTAIPQQPPTYQSTGPVAPPHPVA